MNKRYRNGTLGWDMGDAIMILSSHKTPYGMIYLAQVVNPKSWRGWFEAFTQDHLDRDSVMGPDCNGDLPSRKWFRKPKKLTNKESE